MEFFFWITGLLIPFIMIIMGLVFMFRPPKKINSIYGYRTSHSMASQEAWNYAHVIAGRVWLVIGSILTAVTAAVKLIVIIPPEYLMLIILAADLVLLIAPIPYVEGRLKKQFGK